MEPTAVVALDLARIVSIVVLGGGFGGLAYYANSIEFRKSDIYFDNNKISGCRLLTALPMFIISGIAGAVALQFILILIRIFPKSLDVTDQMLLLSVSVAAGYGSRRILPRITSSLEKRIEAAEQEAEKATKDAEVANQKADKAEKMARIIESIRPTSPDSEKQHAIGFLKEGLAENPLNRYFTIILGRLYRASGSLDEGIAVLDNFLNAKALAGESDRDCADAWYNKACYFALIFGSDNDEDAKNKALAALARSVTLSADNKLDARHDPDFTSIRDDARFEEITN